MRSLRRSLAIALTALSLLLYSAPQAAASASPDPHATADRSPELVPAWDKDLPLGEFTYPSGEGSRAPWTCRIYASDPDFVQYNNIWHVEGFVSQNCSGSGYLPAGVKMTIQMYRGAGLWTNARQSSIAWSNGPYAEVRMAFNCTGTGNEEYRIVADGYAVGAKRRSVGSLNYLRVFC